MNRTRHTPSTRQRARHGASNLVALLAAVLLLALTATVNAEKSPNGHGLSKDHGFTITPPFQRNQWYTVTRYDGFESHVNKDYFALDFSMPVGTPVHPVAPGKVRIAKNDLTSGNPNFEPYGKFVLIEHVNGYFSMYAHLDNVQPLAENAWVDIDAPIGTSGKTGSGSNNIPHLHFVLYTDVQQIYYSWPSFGSATAVVPEPFSGCTKSTGGDCEDISVNNTLRRDDFAPEVLLHPNGVLELFTCNRSQRNLMTKSRDLYGTWSSWTNLEGICASSPSAVRDAWGNVFVFVRGLDGKLWTRVRTGGWSGWYSIADFMIGRPSAALDTVSNLVRVFWRKPINQSAFAAVHVISQSSTGSMGFTGPQLLGGSLTNSPVAARRADGRVDVYAAAPDYTFWKLPDNGNGTYTYETWYPQYVSIEGEPTFVAQGTPQWAAHSTSHQLLVESTSTAMAATHRPAVARHYYGYLYTFGRNRYNSAADYAYQYNGWWPSSTLGGLVTSELAAVRFSNTRIMMFTWGTGGLYYREQSSVNADSWYDWVNLNIP